MFDEYELDELTKEERIELKRKLEAKDLEDQKHVESLRCVLNQYSFVDTGYCSSILEEAYKTLDRHPEWLDDDDVIVALDRAQEASSEMEDALSDLETRLSDLDDGDEN
jgi:hypothetical protein